jgi:hypothetical protein
LHTGDELRKALPFSHAKPDDVPSHLVPLCIPLAESFIEGDAEDSDLSLEFLRQRLVDGLQVCSQGTEPACPNLAGGAHMQNTAQQQTYKREDQTGNHPPHSTDYRQLPFQLQVRILNDRKVTQELCVVYGRVLPEHSLRSEEA